MYSCIKASRRHGAILLRDERGQALVEAPVVILTLCLLTLILFQPVVTLYTRMVLGAGAASLCRVVATESALLDGDGDSGDGGASARLLKTYAAGKIAGLPRGSAFQIPGSLKVDVSGDAHGAHIQVRLSLMQKALPLLGLLVGADKRGQVEVSAEACSVGALAGHDQDASYEYPALGQVP